MNRGRAVAGLALIGLAGVILAGWSPWSWSTSWATPWSTEVHSEQLAAGIMAVQLEDIGAGDVSVRTGDQERTSITASVRTGWWGDSDPSFEREGDVLVLDECRGCTVDYELVVPRGTTVSGESGSGNMLFDGVRAVDVELGSGDLTVRNVPGRVDARTGSGDVTLVGTDGPVDVVSSSGSVRGSSLAGPVAVQASSGDIELELATPQDVRATTSSGDLDLIVPDGRYRVDADGDTDVDLIDDPGARHELVLETSSGDVRVRTR